MVKYVSIYNGNSIYKKKDQKRTYSMRIMQFFSNFFIKAYVVGTHLNCIDKLMQFNKYPQHMLLQELRKRDII